MRLFTVLVAVAVLSGCRDWPDPVIRSVSPAEMVASQSTRVEFLADLALPTTVDYAGESASVDTVAVLRIGRQEVGTGRYPIGGVFSVEVPTVFEPGSYDVQVTLADGRETVLPSGFSVLPGSWPDGYSIDPIEQQQRFVPFSVTVRAQGPNAATFSGNVRLEVPAGASIGPTLSGRFVDGVLTQQIVLSSTRSEEVIIITDVAGNRVVSNPFRLQ